MRKHTDLNFPMVKYCHHQLNPNRYPAPGLSVTGFTPFSKEQIKYSSKRYAISIHNANKCILQNSEYILF